MGEFKGKSIITGLIRLALPIILIAAGVAGFKYFKSRTTEVKRRPPQKTALTVKTITLEKKDYSGKIQGMGTVVPKRQISLKSKVSGEVIFVAPEFVRGGVVAKDLVLCVIDDADYKIEVEKAKGTLDKALADLALEQGNQQVAKAEFHLVNKASKGGVQPTALALRKPQLAQANAAVKNAQADLDKALLNLERTKIKAPFHGLITEKGIDIGSYVSAQGVLATLVDVDAFYVEALIAAEQLKGLKAGKKDGSRAFVHSRYAGIDRQGWLDHFTREISQTSRMAGVLIAVPDPLGLDGSVFGVSLMLNDYVSVEISGQTFKGVVALPRKWLRDGDVVWIYKNGKLQIKPVSIVWKEDGRVFVDQGISQGDEIITSDIPAPVKGMHLVKPEIISASGNADEAQKDAGDSQ